MNNISFNGRKEVIYGLITASKKAKEAEIIRVAGTGPHPTRNFSREAFCDGEMNAYLDSACKDELFLNTIQHLKKDEQKILSENLKSKKLDYTVMAPKERFVKALRKIFNLQQNKKELILLDEFISKL
jgi:hypothetical protein